MAVAMGVRCIEKHITHDRSLRGEDFESALNEDEFRLMVERVRKAEKALGETDLARLAGTAIAYRANVRKRIVAARAIAEGETVTADAVTCKRSDEGLSPSMMDSVVGRRAVRAIAADEGLTLDMLGAVAE
jgi:sialic acid synthase SpsE